MNYNKIIIVAEYFYPNILVGALRMTYLAKFLKSKNIPVEVITSQDCDVIYNDLKIPAIQIYSKKHFLFKLINYYWTIKRQAKKNKKTVFMYSGGPFFYFFIAFLIKKLYKAEYILDFRDSWSISDTDSIPKGFKAKILQLICSFAEKLSIKNAKYIINVTNELNDKYIIKYPKIALSRFKVIFNGYADDELCNIIKNNNISSDLHILKIAVSGKFNYYNPIDSEIISEYISTSDFNCKLYHIGNFEEKLLSDFKKYNCENSFEYIGQKNYLDCMSYLNKMDILILNNRSRYALGTKVFDYIYLNKPILGFVEENSALDNLLKPYTGYFRISSVNDLKNAINKIVTNKINVLSENIDVESFSRERQFEKLLDLLD